MWFVFFFSHVSVDDGAGEQSSVISHLRDHIRFVLGSPPRWVRGPVGAMSGTRGEERENLQFLQTKTLEHTMRVYSIYANLLLCIDNPAQDRRWRPVSLDVLYLLTGRPPVIIDCPFFLLHRNSEWGGPGGRERLLLLRRLVCARSLAQPAARYTQLHK